MARARLRPRRVGAPTACRAAAGRSPTCSSTRRTRSSPTSRAAPRRRPSRPGLALYLCNSNGDAGARTATSTCSPAAGAAASSSPRWTTRIRGCRRCPSRARRSCSSTIRRTSRAPGAASRWTTELGGEVAVAHLLEQGHERIAFAGGPFTLPQIADRLEGARARDGRRRAAEDDSSCWRPTRRRSRRAPGRGAADRPARGPAADGDLLRQRPGRARRAPALHARGRRGPRGRGDRGLRRHRVRDRGRRAPDLGAAAARQSSDGRRPSS